MSEAYAIDFESAWSATYSVHKLGNYRYCNHPEFNAYLVAVIGPGVEFVGDPATFDWSLLSGHTVVSHNASFDECIYRELVKRKIIPQVDPPASWNCTGDLSAYLGCEHRNLENCAKELLEKTLGKALRSYMKDRIYAEESPDIQKQIQEYALLDARTCLEIWNTYSNFWPETERQVSILNREMGYKGVGIDLEKFKKYNAEVTIKIFDIQRSLQEIGFSDDDAIQSPRKFYYYCEKLGIPKPKSLDKKVNPLLDEWIKTYAPKYPWVLDYFTLKRYSSQFKNRLEYISKAHRQDGTVPYSLLYFGAHTGRFTGTGGWNVQTLPKDSFNDIDFRSLIIPRDRTKKIGILDYSAIEPRILLLMSGQKHLLDMVRQGFNIYESYARLHMGWKGGKLKVEDPRHYAICKAMVLSLGYGAGDVKFKGMLSDGYGIETTLQGATSLVNEFRQNNPGIVRLWHEYNRRLNFNVGGRLVVNLPSERTLKCLNIRRNNKGDIECQFGFGGIYKKIYGSKLVENVIQSCARDVFIDGMLRVAQAGYQILLTVHDEIVVEVDDQDDLNRVAEIMKVPPLWMPDLPIGVGAELVDHYKK